MYRPDNDGVLLTVTISTKDFVFSFLLIVTTQLLTVSNTASSVSNILTYPCDADLLSVLTGHRHPAGTTSSEKKWFDTNIGFETHLFNAAQATKARLRSG